MENPISTTAAVVTTPSTSQDTVSQADLTDQNAALSSDEKARQFTEMLNEQQQITELGIKYETAVFDAAQDVVLNATYSEPAKAAKL
ncbi:MAG: hypothetical protein AAFQ09_03040 [Pseudomonadota bacterium]